MQNTMVRGGGMVSWGKHKNWEKGLKNASFWAKNFAPPAANLFVGEKIESQKNYQNAQYISLK